LKLFKSRHFRNSKFSNRKEKKKIRKGRKAAGDQAAHARK
jgi:hypothetical protein